MRVVDRVYDVAEHGETGRSVGVHAHERSVEYDHALTGERRRRPDDRLLDDLELVVEQPVSLAQNLVDARVRAHDDGVECAESAHPRRLLEPHVDAGAAQAPPRDPPEQLEVEKALADANAELDGVRCEERRERDLERQPELLAECEKSGRAGEAPARGDRVVAVDPVDDRLVVDRAEALLGIAAGPRRLDASVGSGSRDGAGTGLIAEAACMDLKAGPRTRSRGGRASASSVRARHTEDAGADDRDVSRRLRDGRLRIASITLHDRRAVAASDGKLDLFATAAANASSSSAPTRPPACREQPLQGFPLPGAPRTTNLRGQSSALAPGAVP